MRLRFGWLVIDVTVPLQRHVLAISRCLVSGVPTRCANSGSKEYTTSRTIQYEPI